MDQITKARTIRGAFVTLINGFNAEGRTSLAKQTTEAISDVPDESMAKLYDILMTAMGSRNRLDEYKVEQQVDGKYAVFQHGGYCGGGWSEDEAWEFARKQAAIDAEAAGER